MSLRDIVLGRPLANREGGERKIGWYAAVPAMGLDGLGSSSYGPEAALTVLIPLGAAGLGLIGWVLAPIIALLGVLYLSYRQVILAYPSNGGAYRVARENLGTGASLVAAAALMIDYILNVAVGISAGVGALVSSIPALHPHILPLCLAILALVALANLRGTREAGLAFAVPTYLFLVTFLALLAWGVIKIVIGGGTVHAMVAPAPVGPPTQMVTVWLVVRAFAAGCTAMTGVEAVSDGVNAFRAPVVREAHRTLTAICVVLGFLLIGIALVAHGFRIGAMDQASPHYQNVLSQLVGAIAGRGVVYYVAMGSLLAVLCLSANTSFVGFPLVCRMVALDDHLPRVFAQSDRRLVYSVGVGFLTITAGLLLIAFGGITDRLIPLFAIGAFLTFTITQVGMMTHWRNQPGARRRLAINALGAAITGVALLVITTAKFAEGAWLVALAIPLTVGLMMVIHRYYARVARLLEPRRAFAVEEIEPPTVLVAYEERNRMTDRALRFAMTLSPDVIAVHLLHLSGPDQKSEELAELRDEFESQVMAPVERAGRTPPRLLQIPAPFRNIEGPLLRLVEKIDADTPGRSVAILIPEMITRHWWQRLLHGRRAAKLRSALLEHAGPRLMVVTSPWRG